MGIKYNTKHKMCDSKLYGVWEGMKDRCYRKLHKFYNRYGGRDIKVCNAWKDSFPVFQHWALENGYKEGLTIERINNDGNYEPSNCKWATRKNQARNRINNRIIKFKNESLPLCVWAERIGLSASCLEIRINRLKWPIDKALTTPNMRG